MQDDGLLQTSSVHLLPYPSYLIHVHVGLGTGSGLPDDQGEVVVVQLSGNHIIGSLRDGIGDLRVQTELLVDQGRGLFQDTHGTDHRLGHTLRGASNREVNDGSHGLRAIVLVSGHLQLAKGVRLDPDASHSGVGGAER